MLELLTVITPIALIDSTSITPIALVPLASVLAGRRPFPTAVAFLLGLFVSYLVMALGFLFGLSTVLMRVNAWVSYRWNHPEPADFAFEILVGLVMLIFGFRILEKRKTKSGGREIREGATPGSAFGFGLILNIVGFPGALPYFAAADRIVQADLPVSGAVLAVIFYVTVFVLPLTVLVILKAVVGRRMDGVMQAVKRFFDTWGKRLALVLLILLGIFLVADGTAYFLRGDPLVPIGYPGLS